MKATTHPAPRTLALGLLLAAAAGAPPAHAGPPLGSAEVPPDGRMWLVDAADIQARARVDRFAGRDEAEACLRSNGVQTVAVPDSAANAKKTRNAADRLLELTGRAARDPSQVAEAGRCAELASGDKGVQPGGLRLYNRVMHFPWHEMATRAVGKDEAGTPNGKPSDSCSWTVDLKQPNGVFSNRPGAQWFMSPSMLDVQPPLKFDLFKEVESRVTVVDRDCLARKGWQVRREILDVPTFVKRFVISESESARAVAAVYEPYADRLLQELRQVMSQVRPPK
jgi:hypothetical protein